MKKAKFQTANIPDTEEGEGSVDNPMRRTRKKNWTDPEIFSSVHVGFGTNEKMSTGKNGPKRMNAFQSSFVTRVKYMTDRQRRNCVMTCRQETKPPSTHTTLLR